MKLIAIGPELFMFHTAKEFIDEFKIGKDDLIVTIEVIYNQYFKEAAKEAHVLFCDKYGSTEPTDEMLDAIIQDASAIPYKRIIGIGGGAVMDMAKVVSVSDGMGIDAIFDKLPNLKRKAGLVLIPTTCGTGSEVTQLASINRTRLGTKVGMGCPDMYADTSVLIPELLKELPWHFFVTSAIDALIHAIESYVSPKSNLYTRMFAKQAMEMLLGGFRKLAGEGQGCRESLYEEFLVASNMAGISFANAGTGAVHAMSYPLSGVYHVTHGEANYQFLTAVFQAYQEKAPEGDIGGLNEFLAGILGCGPGHVYREIEELLGSLIQRKPLREYGMKEEEIRAFAESVEATQQRLLNQSYVKFTADEMEEIYRKLY